MELLTADNKTKEESFSKTGLQESSILSSSARDQNKRVSETTYKFNDDRTFCGSHSSFKTKRAVNLIQDFGWSKQVGNIELFKSQQIFYRLLQKSQCNKCTANYSR